MKAQHTQGRLTTDEVEHDEPYQNIKLIDSDHHTVAIVWIDDAPVRDFNAMQAANARRLVACWNACDGLHTESLERNETLGDQIVDALNQRDELMQTLARVEQKVEALILQRNELLEVVKGLPLYFESGNGVPVTQATIRANTPWVLDARATTAKATGGTP